MRKVLASILTIMMFLTLLPTWAAAAGTVTVTYKTGIVTFSGEGFDNNTEYLVRVNKGSGGTTSPIAMENVTSTGTDILSTDISTGALDPGSYILYINYKNGDPAASQTFDVHTLTVSATNGTATLTGGNSATSGSFSAGAVVSISSTGTGTFNGWSPATGVEAPSSATTTITMPDNDVALTASYSGGGGPSGPGGGGGGGGGGSATSTATVTIGGKEVKVNSDGSVTLSAADVDAAIAAAGGGSVTISLPYTPVAGRDENAYVAVMVVDGQRIIIPLSAAGSDAVNMMIFAGGTYDIIYNPKTFGDTSGHWAADNIAFTASRELFSGTGGGAFSPDTSMTRAMFATVLARLDGVNLGAYGDSRFTDIPSGQWYTAAVEWAAEKGIVSGVGDNMFSPDASITREQMAVMIDRYLNHKGFGLPTTVPANSFGDGSAISDWAQGAISGVQRAGVITGKPGNLFDPQGIATRGEVATVFARFVKALVNN